MRISSTAVQEIINKILNGEDHRSVAQTIIDDMFLQYCLQFFRTIVDAKLGNEVIDLSWYRQRFIEDPTLQANDVLTYSGLNEKSVHNIYGSSTQTIKRKASLEHYDELVRMIGELVEQTELEAELTISIKGVSVVLSLSESLVVVNALAVKRAGIRGGIWSSLGKSVELPLMVTFVHLFRVPKENYGYRTKSLQNREVDFVFITPDHIQVNCEVKLMGQGNPESADAVYSRNTTLFVAHTLSELNREQLISNGIEWVELRNNGYKRLYEVLQRLGVPAEPLDDTKAIENLLEEVAPQISEELSRFLPVE